jgi:hypothetical protein
MDGDDRSGAVVFVEQRIERRLAEADALAVAVEHDAVGAQLVAGVSQLLQRAVDVGQLSEAKNPAAGVIAHQLRRVLV